MSITVPAAPQYASPESWAFVPDGPEAPAKPVDVFFAPGTLLSGEGPMYFDPANPQHRLLARRPRLTQASAFSSSPATGNIFQPHCRQVSMEMNVLPRPELEAAYELPCADMRAAFAYYLEHWNHGRPFILAGHSQGSVLLLDLMKSALTDPAVCDRLVAAYLIGFTVTREDLAAHPGMKLAEGPDDTGVIVTYNTLAKGAAKGLTLLPGALCVNPLNWVNTPDYAPAGLHLGMVEFDDAGVLVREEPRFTDAWIDPALGALMVGVCEENRSAFLGGASAATCAANAGNAKNKADAKGDYFPPGDLHRHNISFFYRNLQENTQRRAEAWLRARQVGGGRNSPPV